MLPVLRLLLIASFFFKYNSTSRFGQLHESSDSTPKHRYIAFLWPKQLHKKKKAKWNLASEAHNTEGKGKLKKKKTGGKGKKFPFLFLAALCQTKQCCFRAVLKGGWLTAAASSFWVNRNIVGIARSGNHLHQWAAELCPRGSAWGWELCAHRKLHRDLSPNLRLALSPTSDFSSSYGQISLHSPNTWKLQFNCILLT